MAAAFVLSRGTPMSLDEAVDGMMGVDKVLLDILSRNQRAEVRPGDV